MVLIDSASDLMATASGQNYPKMENLDYYDYYSDLRDVYLRGAYEKRVKDLETFAKDKNFWAAVQDGATNFEKVRSKKRALQQNSNFLEAFFEVFD